MADDTSDIPILRRKAGAARANAEAGAASPARVFRAALSRAADRVLGLALSVQEARETVHPLAEVLEPLGPGWMLLRLDHPLGAVGLIAMDAQTRAAFIEVQTMGRVLPSMAEDRPPTRTDAAMTERIVRLCLDAFSESLAPGREQDWGREYGVGELVATPRAAELMLADMDYRVIRVRAEYDNGAKTGELHLVLPATLPRKSGTAQEAGAVPDDWAPRLRLAVLDAPAQVTAVLHRMRMPLARVAALRVGETIPIPLEAMSAVRLEAGPGTLVARVRLGQINGNRAVRFGARDLAPQMTPGRAGPAGAAPRSEVPPETSLARPPLPAPAIPADTAPQAADAPIATAPAEIKTN